MSKHQENILNFCTKVIVTLKKTNVERTIEKHLSESGRKLESLKTPSKTLYAELLYVHLTLIIKNLPNILITIPKINNARVTKKSWLEF